MRQTVFFFKIIIFYDHFTIDDHFFIFNFIKLLTFLLYHLIFSSQPFKIQKCIPRVQVAVPLTSTTKHQSWTWDYQKQIKVEVRVGIKLRAYRSLYIYSGALMAQPHCYTIHMTWLNLLCLWLLEQLLMVLRR